MTIKKGLVSRLLNGKTLRAHGARDDRRHGRLRTGRAAFALGLFVAVGVSADLSSLGVASTEATSTDGAASTLTFPLTRGADAGYEAWFNYTTQDGSALAGTDYTSQSGILQLPIGSTSQNLSVPVAGEPAQGDKAMTLRVVGAAGVAANPSFGAAQNVPFAAFPGHNAVSNERTNVAVDINGDGKPDLISGVDSGITVRLNTTTPGAAIATFAAQQTFGNVDDAVFAIASADINGDGKPDLIAVNVNGPALITVLINTTPTGSAVASFAADQTLSVAPSRAYSVAVGDFDGDGKPDLVVLGANNGNLSVLLNTTVAGSNTISFAPPQAVPATGSGNVVDVADFNGDGRADIVFTIYGQPGSIQVLTNTTAAGSSSLSFVSLSLASGGDGPYVARAADIDNDGKPDLIVTNRLAATVGVLRNTTVLGGATSFAAVQTFPAMNAVEDVRAADVNGDGKLDLIVTNAGRDNVEVLVNTSVPGAATVGFRNGLTFATASTPHSLVVADFNLDGKPDLSAESGFPQTFSILLNTTALPGSIVANLAPQPFTLTGFTNNNPQGAAVADINGDGKPDLASAVSGVTVVINTSVPGSGTTSFGNSVSLAAGSAPVGVAFADFNGDGRPDMVVADEFDNAVSVYRNDTAPGALTPAFAARQTFPIPNGFAIPVVAADVDGDGRPDILVFNSGGLQVALNTTTPGAASFSFAAAQTFNVGGSFISMAVADFNGDGRPDVVVGNQDAGVTVTFDTTLPGAATASYSTSQNFPGTNARYVAIADINHDGRPDIVSLNERDGTIAVWRNTGAPGATTPSFAAPQIVSTGANFFGVSIATLDLDGDGRPDVFVSSGDSNGNGGSSVLFLLNTTAPGVSTASFAAPVRRIINTGGLYTGDFNLDGKPDVALVHTSGASGLAGFDVFLDSQYLVVPQATPATGTIHYVSSSAPTADLSTGALDYGSQVIGTTSAPQTVTLTNNGNAPLNIGTITATGAYAQTNDCSSILAVGSFCTFTITFTPTTVGANSGALSISTNAAGSPSIATLGGNGLAATYAITADPTAINFGAQPVGTLSSGQAVTITNSGNSSITVTGATASGSNATDFGISSNSCTTALAAGDSCTITLNFRPGASGSRSASELISTNQSGVSATVAVSGSGAAAAVSLSPASLSFGNQASGTTSAAQTVTLTNSGNSALTISLISVSGAFNQSNNCPASLATGASCAIQVSFAPTGTGSASGALVVSSNAASSPDSIGLSGNGTAPQLTISPGFVDFGNQIIGTTSQTRTLTLSNPGTANLVVGTPGLFGTNPGDFTIASNSCTVPVAPNSSCAITVSFTPSAVSARSANLSVPSNASADPLTVSLAGTGTVVPVTALSLNPTALNFGTQSLNVASAGQGVTLTNSGNTTLSLSTISASGDYTQSNNCPASLAAGASCTITVSFTPTVSGPRSGTVSVVSNAGSSPDSISLTGVGTAPAVSLSPVSLSFGNQTAGTTSAAQTVTLTNSGNSALTVSLISVSGAFGQSNNCPASLAASASCAIQVSFAPAGTGAASGALTVTSNAASSPDATSLSGNGTAPGLTISPGSLDFGNQTVNTTSASRPLTVSNPGSASLIVGTPALVGSNAGDFTITANSCTTPVAPNSSCTISLSFTPSAASARSANLSVPSNASADPMTVNLSGTGTAVLVTSLSLNPTSLDFGNQRVSSTSSGRSVTLTNTGNTALAISAITASGDYGQSNSCPASLPAAGACTITVTFTPQSVGTRGGSVIVRSSAGSSPDSLSLTGVGTQPGLQVPSTLSFGSSRTGTAISSNLTVQNTGSASLTLGTPTFSGSNAAEFVLASNGCTAAIAPGGSCVLGLRFTPGATGSRAASLSIPSDAPGSPASVALSGTGTAPIAQLSPASITFSDQIVGSTGATRSVQLTNTGSDNLAVQQISVAGSNAADFTQSNACPASLAPAASCTITLSFTPAVVGARSANLSVSSDTSGSPATVSLAGNGVAQAPAPAPVVHLSPASLQFGSQVVGTVSETQSVSLSNAGTAALVINAITASGDYTQSSDCPASLPVESSCTITVSFRPSASGARAGSIAVSSNAASTPDTVALSGTGTAPGVTLGSAHLDFPDQTINTTGAAQTVTLTNSGSSTLSLGSIVASGDYAQTNTCGESLNAGASCTITIRFTPTTTGLRTGAVTISSNAPGSPMQITLSGNGLADQFTATVKAGGGAAGGPMLLGLLVLLALRWRRRLRNAALLLGGLALTALPAQALKLDESYVGFRAGVAASTQDSANLTSDLRARGYDVQGHVQSDDFSGTVYAGYRVLDNVSVEVAYTHLPELTATVSGTRPANLSSLLEDTARLVRGYGDVWSLGLRYDVPLGLGFSLQPRAAIDVWETHVRINAGSAKLDRNDVGPGGTVGIGLRYGLGRHLGIGLGYDFYLATRQNQFHQFAAGLDWHF